jgi:lipopolysaccharide export system protein LptA
MTIDSKSAVLGRRERTIRLEGGVTVVGSPQSATAESALVHLTPDDKTDRIDLTGRASVTGDGTGPFRAMKGEAIALDYAADGRTLERATITGGASVDLSAASGSKTLAGASIDAALGPDGQTVTALEASGKVGLTLPAEGTVPARTVRSETLKGRGDAAGINGLAFAGGVEYREAAAESQGSTPRTATSETLDATLQPGFGAITEARFKGRVIFRDGGVRAEGPDARYAIDRGLLQLAGTPTVMPRVVDERVSIDARAIDLTTGSKRLQAKGDVRSILAPQNQNAKDRRMPAMLERDKPVNVTAAALSYDGDAARAIYTGNARLWQGETSIQADVLTLDDKQGNLTGKGAVLSRLFLEDKEKKDAKKAETLARGDTLAYDNTARKAVYEPHARVTGPQGDVAGDRIELFLDEAGRSLDRAEAYRNVAAQFEGGHHATGSRLTYFADGERYTMSGAPVRILEKVPDGCRETAGAALTFIRSTDTIAVVGNEGSRSRTTPGSCAELPR